MNKGKNFTCCNDECKEQVTLTSEGNHFICPKCGTKNIIGNAAVGVVQLLQLLAALFCIYVALQALSR